MGDNYVVAKGSGGLGNRILSAATGLLFARISGRRLVIDWTDGSYSPLGINAFHRFFDCPRALEVDALPNTSSVYPETWRGQLGKSLADLRDKRDLAKIQHLTIDVARTDYEQDILVFCAYNQETHRMKHLYQGEFSYLRSMSVAERVAKIVIEEMPINQDLENAVESFSSRHFQDNNIGVHVRYTDYKIDLDRIFRKTDRLAERRTRPQFFLATDSQQVESDFRRRYDNVLTTNKWYPPSGGRLHRNMIECTDLFQNGVEALVDLHLLSRCDSLVYSSRSSYGSLAAWLNPSARQIDIERTAKILTRKFVRNLIVDSRPARQRFGLTKSAIKGLFVSANPADKQPS